MFVYIQFNVPKTRITDLVKLQLYDAIYRLRFYSNSFIHILLLPNLHNNVASIQKNRDDKSHSVIVALEMYQLKRFIDMEHSLGLTVCLCFCLLSNLFVFSQLYS